MNEVMNICGTELQIKRYSNQRIVTFKDIDAVHQRPAGTARKRFNDNKKHFIEGEDFFKVKCSEVRPFFGQTPPNGFNPNAAVILITESGYLMLVKSFTDDLAWEVQRKLVNSYFKSEGVPQALSVEDAFKMVELINNTPADRLELVSAVLKQAGVDIPQNQPSDFHGASVEKPQNDKWGICDFLKTTSVIGRMSANVYQEYINWCNIHDIIPLAHNVFSRRVNQILGTKTHNMKINGQAKRLFIEKR